MRCGEKDLDKVQTTYCQQLSWAGRKQSTSWRRFGQNSRIEAAAEANTLDLFCILHPSINFPVDPHAKANACHHVFERSHPVLLVSRAEGDWCFLCGGHHANDASEYRVVGIGHVIESDSALPALHDLPVDREAERENGDSPWVHTPLDPTRD
jgi:hypothetical protein